MKKRTSSISEDVCFHILSFEAVKMTIEYPEAENLIQYEYHKAFVLKLQIISYIIQTESYCHEFICWQRGNDMKKVRQLLSSCASRCMKVITALPRKLRRKTDNIIPEPENTESIFQREWTIVLTENASTFNGLYSGLMRVRNGNAKRPEKVLREWCQRTHYKFEDQPVDILCQENIQPLIEAADRDGLTKWANLLLDAAAAAGITKEETSSLVLTEINADAYVEWDGNDLYPEDEIEVITPAWYQNGKILEQGQCRKVNTEEA